MKKLDISELPGWPEEVIVAYCETSEEVDPSVLTSQEQEEFDAFVNPNRKSEYLIGRALFRFLVKESGLNPEQVELLKEEKGKPYAKLDDEIIYVSFSHSQKLVMCAVSRKYDIGIDVESEERHIKDGVVKRILNEDEWKVIGYENLLKLWTIKEAAVKCSGLGLQTKLKNLSIRKKNNNRFLIRFNNDVSAEICSFNVLNHQISLAYQSIHS